MVGHSRQLSRRVFAFQPALENQLAVYRLALQRSKHLQTSGGKATSCHLLIDHCNNVSVSYRLRDSSPPTTSCQSDVHSQIHAYVIADCRTAESLAATSAHLQWWPCGRPSWFFLTHLPPNYVVGTFFSRVINSFPGSYKLCAVPPPLCTVLTVTLTWALKRSSQSHNVNTVATTSVMNQLGMKRLTAWRLTDTWDKWPLGCQSSQ